MQPTLTTPIRTAPTPERSAALTLSGGANPPSPRNPRATMRRSRPPVSYERNDCRSNLWSLTPEFREPSLRQAPAYPAPLLLETYLLTGAHLTLANVASVTLETNGPSDT